MVFEIITLKMLANALILSFAFLFAFKKKTGMAVIFTILYFALNILGQ